MHVESFITENVISASEGDELTFYIATIPLEECSFTVTATTVEDKKHYGTITTKSQTAGKLYICNYTVEEFVEYYDGIENGYKYVDLGLPSGLKWATMNIGASSPEESDNYYAWGEIEPKDSYRWNSYKFAKIYDYTKYCDNEQYGTIDNKMTLEKMDDAASMNWGGTWRMPTYSELKELVNKCYWVWTNNYGVTQKAGYIVYKAKNSSDKGIVITLENTSSSEYSLLTPHIFLPITGVYYDHEIYNKKSGYYWSASLTEYNNGSAKSLCFSSKTRVVGGLYCQRVEGISVRAVCK